MKSIYRLNPQRLLAFLLLLSFLVSVSVASSQSRISKIQSQENPREGWAVLLEMNDYPNSMTDMDTNFTDTRKWNATLHELGWQTHHIQYYQGYLDQATGESALQFLLQNADANDVVFFFIFAHGNWILDEMNWNIWFPNQWQSLSSQEKLLVVSACGAEEMLSHIYDDPAPHIHIASAQIGEYSWAGLPEEGLPIIGEVFSHFLTDALLNASADQDGSADISVEEAFTFAYPLCRVYLSSVVFSAFPYFANMCNYTAPHPVLDDAYPGNFSLRVEPGEPPMIPVFSLPFDLIIMIGAIMTCSAIGGLGLFAIRKRHYSNRD